MKLELNTEKLERCIRYSLERASSLKVLRSNERKFRSIFERSKDAVFLTDESLVFKDVNDITSEMLGYSKDELMELTLNQFFASLERAQQITGQLRAEGNVEDLEVELLNRKRGYPAIHFITFHGNGCR